MVVVVVVAVVVAIVAVVVVVALHVAENSLDVDRQRSIISL